MDVTISCQVSISKKLRALIGNNETRLTLITESLKDGRASANIVLSLDDFNKKEIDDLINKETSIMFTPTEIVSGIPSSVGVTNIFSSNIESGQSAERTPVDRIATIKAPENKQDRRYAIKSQEEMETPREFKAVKNPEFKKYITDLNQLLDAVKYASENKTYDVDISAIKDPRKRAIALEEKDKMEAIDYPAFIVNDKCADVTINDLGIHLMLNIPFNLANISSKRIAASMELKAMFRNGMIKFISPDEISEYIHKVEQIQPGLQTFSRHEDAEASLENKMGNVEQVEIGPEDTMELTEQESLARNIPLADDSPTEGIRKSSHGMSAPRVAKTVSEESKKSTAGLKTIRRTGIEYR